VIKEEEEGFGGTPINYGSSSYLNIYVAIKNNMVAKHIDFLLTN
jgi:hypothetical protein